jgi:hypothetical protein
MNVAGRSVVVAFVGTLLWAACGSDNDSGGEDSAALCKQGCDKVVSLCFADAGDNFQCTCPLPPDGGASPCANQSEMTAAYKACLEKTTCQDLLTCKIPKCVMGDAGG